MAFVLASAARAAHSAAASRVLAAGQINTGGKIPAVNVKQDNPEKGFTLDLSGKNIIFSGASVYQRLWQVQGIKDIYVVAINDTFVTKAWKEKVAPQVNWGELASSLGLIFDASGLLGSPRSKRYAIVAQDNKVQFIAVETKPAETTMSASKVVLSQIA